jgi:hypothetical protein
MKVHGASSLLPVAGTLSVGTALGIVIGQVILGRTEATAIIGGVVFGVASTADHLSRERTVATRALAFHHSRPLIWAAQFVMMAGLALILSRTVPARSGLYVWLLVLFAIITAGRVLTLWSETVTVATPPRWLIPLIASLFVAIAAVAITLPRFAPVALAALLVEKIVEFVVTLETARRHDAR